MADAITEQAAKTIRHQANALVRRFNARTLDGFLSA